MVKFSRNIGNEEASQSAAGTGIMARLVRDFSSGSNIVQVTSEPISFSAGAAGTTGTAAFDSSPIFDSNGVYIGNKDDTSFSWDTGTVLTLEVGYGYGLTDAEFLATLELGQFAIDYINGQLFYNKATTGTSDAATYKTRAISVGTPASSDDPVEIKGQYKSTSLVDTTNVSAATHYYPSATGESMDGYKDLSMSGKFIDADGTLTLTLEAMNDEDTTSGDWISAYFYDDQNNATVNSLTVTNGTLTMLVSAKNANFSYYRWVVVANGATNTVILKERRKAL